MVPLFIYRSETMSLCWYLQKDAHLTRFRRNVHRSIGNGMNGPVPESDDSYILQFCSGTSPSNFHFWIEAESDRSIDAVVVGHFLEVWTPEMNEFKNALPSWMTTMDGVSTWSTMQI